MRDKSQSEVLVCYLGYQFIILTAVRDEFISQIIHTQTHQPKEDTQSQFTQHEHRTDKAGFTSTS